MARKHQRGGEPVFPNIQDTVAEVFIVESLKLGDEQARRFEGRILNEMLQLAGMNPKYYYFQSEDELRHVPALFRASRCRFLHVSTHATNSTFGTTNGNISYDRFGEIFAGHLSLRRLFVSACEIGNKEFVEAVATRNKGMHSIVAPTVPVPFDQSAAFWCAFYISCFAQSSLTMKHDDIRTRLKSLTKLFPLEFFLATYSPRSDDWKYRVVN